MKRRQRHDIKMLLVGSGREKPRLMKRAESEQLDNCVFLDPVPKERVAALMAGADVGLMILANVPSFYYGTSPNKFFDYLASGMPVLTNYPGWVADLIGEARCGTAVPPGNAESFADALERYADDRDSVSEQGVRARALGEDQFDWNVLADRFCMMFAELDVEVTRSKLDKSPTNRGKA